MEFLIDSANIEKIKEIYDNYSIDGVTTNPTILSKENKNPYEVLKEIRQFIGSEAKLHVQVVSRDYDTMLLEAKKIVEVLGKNTYIKVPVTPTGIKAIKYLVNNGYNVTATAIYTTTQAFMAGKIGVKYVAPYINRIDDLGIDGIKLATDINSIFKNSGIQTKILAASFKSCYQVTDLLRLGIEAVTVSPDTIEKFLKVDSSIMAVEKFAEDFEGLCGKNKNMFNID